MRTVAELLHAGKPLSAREVEILQLTADGVPAVEIGRRLFLATETVKSHKKSIQGKLKALNGTHAVAIGLRRGLIT